MNLKLSSIDDKKHQELFDVLRSKEVALKVKIATTKKNIIPDNKDNRYIKSLNNVKIILGTKNGILILIGNLQNSFVSPFGGEFYLKKYVEEKIDFNEVKGYSCSVRFVTVDKPSSIDEMRNSMDLISNSPNFEFNLTQFDEFMEIFEFYKKLSDELNNNVSYQITEISRPYYYLSFDVKDFESEFKREILDQNGVIKGYRVEISTYETLKNEIKEQVQELVDVRIIGGAKELAKILRVGVDNIYLSNVYNVGDQDVKNLKQFTLVNIRVDKNEIILSGEFKVPLDGERLQYVNLYDMGQKIKVESIENSLKLIKQGATGAASKLLEYLIGDEKMPNEKSITNTIKDKYLRGLNASQKEAFLMAIDGNPVSLIKGPPGTGKTHVINAIVQYITKELNEKVIISSQTHIAIDNVLDKLVENYDLVIPNRITNRKNKYSGEYIDETLFRTWGKKFENHNKNVSNRELSLKMLNTMKSFNGEKRFVYSEKTEPSDYSVIGATTTTSAIAGKKGLEVLKGYDWLIIDEVSKCPITEVLRYLPYVSKIIMVGDDFQLAPLLEFTKDDVKHLQSYNENLFDKLQMIYEQSVFAKVLNKAKESKRMVLLKENYRSVEQVLATYNVFYDGALIGKRETARPEKCHFNENGLINYEEKDVMFVEVNGGQEQRDGTSRFNVEELKATAIVLEDLIKNTINAEDVSVSAIFPYASQISHFQKRYLKLINEAKKRFKSFEIDTVDAFQGKETDVVLVNTVVTDPTQGNFLKDFRRINVSMSRAKDKLIVFGNSYVLKKINMKISGGIERKYFGDIINYISANGKYITYNGGEIKNGNKSKCRIELA